MNELHPILPCQFVARLLENLARHYEDRGCELVLAPHTDASHEFAYAAVTTSSSLDLVRSPITNADPIFDVVSMIPVLAKDVSPLALVYDAVSEGAWG